jgi:hypothetical protein
MIDAQSMVVSSSATHQIGNEAAILMQQARLRQSRMLRAQRLASLRSQPRRDGREQLVCQTG